MSAPRDPVADVVACLLAIIEGLCRLLAEQAAREAEAGLGADLRAKWVARLTERLRRIAEEVAAAGTARADPVCANPPARAKRRSPLPRRPGRAWRAASGARPRPRSPGPAPLLFDPNRRALSHAQLVPIKR
jgi:hypothetical protein